MCRLEALNLIPSKGGWVRSCYGEATPTPCLQRPARAGTQREKASLPRTPLRDKLVGKHYHAQGKEQGHKEVRTLRMLLSYARCLPI